MVFKYGLGNWCDVFWRIIDAVALDSCGVGVAQRSANPCVALVICVHGQGVKAIAVAGVVQGCQCCIEVCKASLNGHAFIVCAIARTEG